MTNLSQTLTLLTDSGNGSCGPKGAVEGRLRCLLLLSCDVLTGRNCKFLKVKHSTSSTPHPSHRTSEGIKLILIFNLVEKLKSGCSTCYF